VPVHCPVAIRFLRRNGHLMKRYEMRDRDAESVVDPIIGPAILVDSAFRFSQEAFDRLETDPTVLRGRVSKNPQTAAVILSGGSGERSGVRGGKQLLRLSGKPVMTWSAEAFDAVPDVGLIVIVVPEERIDEYCRIAIDPYLFVTPIIIAASGELRQESSFNGVNKVPHDFSFIAIHDGARPLVTPELVVHAISAVKGNLDADGAVIGYPAIDTLKVVNHDQIIGTPDREAFWVAQTPQVFRADVIREAHAMALAEGFIGTDDSSLVERAGGNIFLVEGPRDNIKVTVPEDIVTVDAALRVRYHGLGLAEEGDIR